VHGLLDTQAVQRGTVLLLRDAAEREPQRKQAHHDPVQRPALPWAPNHAPKGVGEGSGKYDDRKHFQQIGERCWILIGMRAIGVEEASTIGSQVLDPFQGGDGTLGMTWRPPSRVVTSM